MNGQDSAETRTGGETLVDAIVAHDIDTVFGIPGAQVYGLFDAFATAEPPLRVVSARHEQGCGYMAFGAAKATGRPAVFSVVPGPGLLNSAAGLLTALGCNTPVLCLTGQVPTDFLDRGRGHLHEMPDQLATLRGFVKHAERVEHPTGAGSAVGRSFQAMTGGRPGPAAVEMPWNVFTQRTAVATPEVLPPLERPPVDDASIERALDLLRTAKAPMIFVGSGAMDCGAAVLQLAERLDAPVVAFRSGRGIVSNAQELGPSMAAAWHLWPQTDLVIGIGTRLELPTWRWPYRPAGQKSIRIDIDPAEMRRFAADVAIVGDAGITVEALLDALPAKTATNEARRTAIRDARARAAVEIREIQPQMGYLDVLRDVLPADGIVTDEMNQAGFTAWFGFDVYEPRTFISSGYQGTLGAGFPTALGAKVACPDKAVVSICGDGGFMFAVQELATAVQHGIGVVTLVFNNDAYGNVRRDQLQHFGGRTVGSDLVNPDFVALGRAFGVEATRVTTPEAFRPVLEKAIAADRPALIEITVPRDGEASPWRFIHPQRPA